MTPGITFNIYVMSYQRPHKIMTKNCLEYCTYVVREEEADTYRNAGIDDMLVIPKDATLECGGKVHSFMSTLYWIIENTPEDVIFVADDDIKRFCYRLDNYTAITAENYPDWKERTCDEILRIGQLLYDLNLGLAFDNPQMALYVYDKESCFKGMPGHVRWINKKALKARYDLKDPAISDVDMMLQELLMNRVVLLPKYFHSYGIQASNEGGTTIDSRKNYEYRCAMKNKWGKYYEFDFRKNTAKINVKR